MKSRQECLLHSLAKLSLAPESDRRLFSTKLAGVGQSPAPIARSSHPGSYLPNLAGPAWPPAGEASRLRGAARLSMLIF